MSWRSFAAAALPLTSKHQVSPSIGPAFTAERKVSGISELMASSRALDSLTSSVSRHKEGELSTA